MTFKMCNVKVNLPSVSDQKLRHSFPSKNVFCDMRTLRRAKFSGIAFGLILRRRPFGFLLCRYTIKLANFV